MAVEVIDKIKPKNGGSFPIVEAVDVEVSDGVRLPEALAAKASQTDLNATNASVATKANTSDLSTATADLQAQIDALITPVTEDAEVENARVGANGKTYTTLKARLDAEESGNKADKDLLTELNSGDVFVDNSGVNFTQNNASFAWTGNQCTVSVSGTVSAKTYAVFYQNTSGFPTNVNIGENIAYFTSTNPEDIYVEIYYYTTEWKVATEVKATKHFTIPATANGLMFRIVVKSGTTTGATLRFGILNNDPLSTIKTNLETKIDSRIYSKPATSYVSDSTITLADVLVDGYYLIDTTWTVTDAPEGITVTALTVQNFQTAHTGKYVKQIAESTGSNGKAFYRFSNSSGAFSLWIEIINPRALTPYLRNDVFLPSGDLNDVTTNTFRLLSSTQTYDNAPASYPEGFLFVMSSSSWVLQIWYSLNGSDVYKRRRSNQAVWSDWVSIGSGGGGGGNVYNITNEYTMPHYENTYNITASPTITADTNDYLAPSGDNSDRTNDIETMLNTVNVCRLGSGIYYVTDLAMPDNSMIIGSGPDTIIRLSGYDSTEGFAIRMNKNCTVKDLTIEGSSTDISMSADVLNRHGILWEGNANVENASDTYMPERGTIENVTIRHFKGGAITCTNTGTGIKNCLNVNDVYIYDCRAGINIAYSSEFHRFTNCHVMGCYYGCINNGGNNAFVNCCFSSNTIGFLIDNSSGQSPNNAHGSAVGCIFNHSGANAGIGIKIINTLNGFTFVGCQVFYSQIYLEDVSGFNISDSVFGDTNCNITITNGGAIMFNNNQFKSRPTITVTNNDKTHFNNNYVRESGQAVTP